MSGNKFSQAQFDDIVKALQRAGDSYIAKGNAGTGNLVKTLEIDLSVAPTNPRQIGFPFNTVVVQDATDSAAKITLQLFNNNAGVDSIDLNNNDTFGLDNPVSDGYLTWEAQSNKTIKLLFIRQGQYRPGSLFTEVAGSVDGNSITPTVVSVDASGTTLLSAQNTAKKAVNIYTTSTIQIAESSGASVWFTLTAGYHTLKNTAAIYAKTLGGTVDVEVLTES